MSSLWKTQREKNASEIDVRQLIVRLEAIKEQDNVEIIQLIIQSMLEEIKDYAR